MIIKMEQDRLFIKRSSLIKPEEDYLNSKFKEDCYYLVLRVFEDDYGWYVGNSKTNLYRLLYILSKNFDIELI